MVPERGVGWEVVEVFWFVLAEMPKKGNTAKKGKEFPRVEIRPVSPLETR